MANQTGDRGFNNIHSSAVAKRQQNRALQKYTMLGVIALAALAVLMLMVLAVGGIISNIRGEIGRGPDNEKVEWGSFTVTAADTLHGDLVLVNNAHVYTFPQSEEHLSEIWGKWNSHNPRIYKQSGVSKYMDTDALNAMDAMLVDFSAATGKTNVQVRYAYRDYKTQEQFEIAAGYSDHHTGLGVQLKYEMNENAYAFSTDPNGTYNWIFENCHKYGFVIRYPEGKEDITEVSDYSDYFRYVGIAHATYMAEHGLCMEEYIEVLKGYTHDKPLKINGAEGRSYEVYYVAVDGSATVKHPTNYAYSVSGTNEGGVVITVNRSKALTSEETTASDTATPQTTVSADSDISAESAVG
jgi:D-alanyl-D-alanine carboxypeptidase